MASIEVEAASDCGWWPPGEGEPGTDWGFDPARLQLVWDGPGESLDVMVVTPEGPRALVAVPIRGIARLLAEGAAEAVADV